MNDYELAMLPMAAAIFRAFKLGHILGDDAPEVLFWKRVADHFHHFDSALLQTGRTCGWPRICTGEVRLAFTDECG